MAKTVAEIADGFIASVLEPTAPEVQKMEMRKAFMSGFLAALLDIDKIANSHDEAEAAHMLDALLLWEMELVASVTTQV